MALNTQRSVSLIQTIARSFIPPLLDPVLGDYLRSIPDARDPEVVLS